MRTIKLKTVFFIMSVSFASARYLRSDHLTNNGNQSDVQIIELAGIDNEDISKELENVSNKGYGPYKDVVIDNSQNIKEDSQTIEEDSQTIDEDSQTIEEDSQTIEKDKKRMIIRQLMFIINKYHALKYEKDLHVSEAISEENEMMLKDKSEQLNVSKDIFEAKSHESGDRQNTIGETMKSSYTVLNYLPREQIYSLEEQHDEKVSETAQSQSKECNDWPESRNVKPNEKISVMKDMPHQTFDNNNDLSNKGNKSKDKENENEKSHSRDDDYPGRDEIPDDNESRNDLSEDGIYDISRDTNETIKNNESRYEVPNDKNNTFNSTVNEYKSAEGNGYNDMNQIKGDIFEENALSHDDSNVKYQNTYGTNNDSNDTVSSKAYASAGQTRENQGNICIHQCREDAMYQEAIVESQRRDEKGQFSEDKTQGRDRTDVVSRSMFFSRNNMNKGKTNRKYQVKKDKFKDKNNTPLNRDSKDKNKYHDVNYKKQGMNNVPQSKTRYWMT